MRSTPDLELARSGVDVRDLGVDEQRRICAHHRRGVRDVRRNGGPTDPARALTAAAWRSTAGSVLTTVAAWSGCLCGHGAITFPVLG